MRQRFAKKLTRYLFNLPPQSLMAPMAPEANTTTSSDPMPLIEGESLLNDGTAYAAFIIMQSVTRSMFAKNGLPTNSHYQPLIQNAFEAGAICNVTVTEFKLDDNEFCVLYSDMYNYLYFYHIQKISHLALIYLLCTFLFK